jgi:hypothetical protein
VSVSTRAHRNRIGTAGAYKPCWGFLELGPPWSEAVAKRIVDINPVLSLQQMVDPRFELSLLPGAGNPGAAGMIQRVGDFLLAQDIIKVKIDGKAAVDGSWVAEYLKVKR